MLARFCLYGFLRNQRYFDPFIVLIFMAKGLSFFEIGLLIAVREVLTNLLEVVSGAMADAWGRRKTLVCAWVAYIVSFVSFAVADAFAVLVVAMALMGVGDAFRSGTHKAMIFAWLKAQGREAERTKIYGQTRSWSKLGAAVSVVVAAGIVLWSGELQWLFWGAALAYILGLVNFMGYPASLDGGMGKRAATLAQVRGLLTGALRASLRVPSLRGLMVESMAFGGVFKSSKDYLQPVLQVSAVALFAQWPFAEGLGDSQRTAILLAPVYVALFLMSAAASRRAGRIVERAGSEARAGVWCWGVFAALFLALLPATIFSMSALVIVLFVALHVLHDAWRPILVGRFDVHSGQAEGATIMSLESQARSLATMVVAPLLGASVDALTAPGQPEVLWPVAALGAAVGVASFFRASRVARVQSE